MCKNSAILSVGGSYLANMCCHAEGPLSNEQYSWLAIQDALTKTIPIWAAVINKAVRVYRQKARQQLITANEAAPSIAHPARRGANALGCSAEDAELSSSAGTTASSSEGANKLHWDEEIHLPIWISSTEKAQIDQHLQEWAEKLTEVRISKFFCYHLGCPLILMLRKHSICCSSHSEPLLALHVQGCRRFCYSLNSRLELEKASLGCECDRKSGKGQRYKRSRTLASDSPSQRQGAV